MLLAGVLVIATFIGAKLYVSPNGSDRNPGTASSPLKGIQTALDRLKPGTTVVLLPGTYSLERRLTITAKGSPERWVALEAEPPGQATLDFSNVKPINLDDAHSNGAIDVSESDYLRIAGLKIRDSHFFGIYVKGGCRFIDIQRNDVLRTFGPAIGVWNSTDIRVVGNRVSRANTQLMRLFGDPRVECPHEAISIAGVDRFEVAWNSVLKTDKEGIDVKEVSRNGVVHHNHVRAADRQGLYVDAWLGLLENVRVTSNLVHECEWGVVVSVEGAGSELRKVQIDHNVIASNRASGVYFGTWGGDGPRSDIVIANNTIVDNGTPQHWAGPTGSIDLRSKNFRRVTIARNITRGGGAFELASALDFAGDANLMEEQELNLLDNLFAPGHGDLGHPSPYGVPKVVPVPGQQIGIVTFRGLDRLDFRLVDASPALGRGALPDATQDRLPHVASPLRGFPGFTPKADEFEPEARAWFFGEWPTPIR